MPKASKRLLTVACARASQKDKVLLDNLCRQAFHPKLELARCGLVLYTFGNASGNSRPEGFGRSLHDKQYSRKHGRDAYYGQAVRNGTY